MIAVSLGAYHFRKMLPRRRLFRSSLTSILTPLVLILFEALDLMQPLSAWYQNYISMLSKFYCTSFLFVFVNATMKTTSRLFSSIKFLPCYKANYFTRHAVSGSMMRLLSTSSAERAVEKRDSEQSSKHSTNVITRSPSSMIPLVDTCCRLTCSYFATQYSVAWLVYRIRPRVNCTSLLVNGVIAVNRWRGCFQILCGSIWRTI